MDYCQVEPLRDQFDRLLRIEFQGATVPRDAGLLAYRVFDHAVHLSDSAGYVPPTGLRAISE